MSKQARLNQHDLEKKRILQVLELERRELVQAARRVARILFEESKEPVTAWQVFEAMHSVEGIAPILAKHDKRWLGAVFKGPWSLVGYEKSGSHCRLVAKWIPSEH